MIDTSSELDGLVEAGESCGGRESLVRRDDYPALLPDAAEHVWRLLGTIEIATRVRSVNSTPVLDCYWMGPVKSW